MGRSCLNEERPLPNSPLLCRGEAKVPCEFVILVAEVNSSIRVFDKLLLQGASR